MIIDGERHVLGRLASFVAKRLLEGEKIQVINAEKIVITGKKETILREYKELMNKKNIDSYKKGPHRPKKPDGLFRRTVRGMLPYKKERGRKALKGLKVYVGTPREFEGKEVRRVDEADAIKLGRTKLITLGELCKLLGSDR
ncbi:MAG: 50S ribosomal protein L13 [Candidatus Hydrothermarchaeota archaeon]